MPSRPLAGALIAAAVALAGCTFPPGLPSSPTPSGPVGEVISVSAVPGSAVDRPVLPASAARPAGFATAPSGAGLTGYLNQRIDWSECDLGECADVLVPLDYGNPARQAITVSMAKIRASASPKLGTLFINPGGPGGSGKELLGGFQRRGLERFDIIGWDPRGTGDSTPVKCYGDARTDQLNDLDASPDDPAETDALIIGSYEFGKSCWENSGELLEHISTVDTVRDLDLLRAFVKDAKLNYLGYSYGTAIGATYTELFPSNTGRLVLDAAVDITDDDPIIQAMGFDLALNNFATWCAAQQCALGSSKDAVLRQTTDFLDRLDGSPLKVGPRQLTQSLATVGIAAYLYGGIPAWQVLARDIGSAIRGNGQRLLFASDALNDRDPTGHYGQRFYSFPAISCADYVDDGLTDAAADWTNDIKKAPIFGKYFGPQVNCSVWPVKPQLKLDIRGRGAAPLLVIGATGDPATPYQQAVTMAQRLESGILVTYQGEGHGTYGGKSACVDAIVVSYLTRGTLPQDGVRCS